MTYRHALTDLEEALGVTLEDVARELPRGAFIDEGRAYVTDVDSPALAMSVARAAFVGAAVRFAGLNALGFAVYRLDKAEQH